MSWVSSGADLLATLNLCDVQAIERIGTQITYGQLLTSMAQVSSGFVSTCVLLLVFWCRM